MTTFFYPEWDGYVVTVKPCFWLRKFIKYHRWYLPFMSGEQIALLLSVNTLKPISRTEDIKCLWTFRKAEDNQEFGSDECIIHISPKEKPKPIVIKSRLILEPVNYVLELQLARPNQDIQGQKPQIIATVPVKDRGDVTMDLLVPLFISIATLILSVILSVIAVIITARIVG